MGESQGSDAVGVLEISVLRLFASRSGQKDLPMDDVFVTVSGAHTRPVHISLPLSGPPFFVTSTCISSASS